MLTVIMCNRHMAVVDQNESSILAEGKKEVTQQARKNLALPR
jgi:hypothetical protein